MFINRITFSIDKNKYKEQDWIAFNRVTSYYEELLHNLLPRKVNLGGFGFFSNKLQVIPVTPLIKPYGQCIDYFHLVEENEVTEFLQLQPNKQLDKLNDFLKKSVLDISKEHKVDTEVLLEAIKQSPTIYEGFEQKLKVSKNHKSRKIKIEIIRSVSLKKEKILCRILNKSNSIMEDWTLEDNTSIYDSSYSYRKSKWKENKLEIYDRFDEIHKVIDVNKYINKNT